MGELFVVVLLMGMVLGGAMIVVEPDPKPSSIADVQLTDQKRYCEIPLGDEFVCIVELTRISRTDNLREPYCISRLRIASTRPETPGPFLLEVLSFEQSARVVPAQCRIWSLMSPNDSQKYALQFQEEIAASWAGPKIFHFPPRPTVVSTDSLEDAIWNLVPPALRETGHLVQTREVSLEALPQVREFPLQGIASAIRRASEEGRWQPGDIHATLCAFDEQSAFDEHLFWLSDENTQMLARMLLLRLVKSLPGEGGVPLSAR